MERIPPTSMTWVSLRESRKLRIEYPESIYHVMDRGDQREYTFRDDGNGDILGRSGIGDHCLMALTTRL